MSAAFDRHEFGKRLRRIRSARGLSMQDLAAQAAITYGYIRALEVGVRAPSTDLVARLARALGVSPDDLFGITDINAVVLGIKERGNLRPLEGKVQPASKARYVRVIGRVPAGEVRFSLIEEEGADVPMVEVRPSDLAGSRSPYALEVSGNCLQALGIYSGDIVICDRPMGRTPRSGDLVVVRIGSEYTLKRWIVAGPDVVELRDGDGNLAVRLTVGIEFELVGLYLTYLPGPR